MSHKVVSNYSEVQDERIPFDVGQNLCVVDSVTMKVATDSSKSDQLQLGLEGSEQKNRGKYMYDYLAFSERAMWRVQQLLKAAKIPEGYEFDFDDQNDLAMLTKYEIKVQVVNEPYTNAQGVQEVKRKVKNYFPADTSNDKQESGESAPANNKKEDDIPF